MRKLIGAAVKFYLVAVVFAFILTAITGVAVVREPDQQGNTNVYIPR